MVKSFFFSCSFCLLGILSWGQESKKDQSTSVESVLPQKEYAPKKKKSKNSKTTYDARDNFYDRQEALSDQRSKDERNADNPKYSDPQYFGHKRPPRKRAASKMKFCKVCGIRH